jgi:dolichol-phosphate mannosyltransferase
MSNQQPEPVVRMATETRRPMSRVCVLMPAFNEADNLAVVVPEALEVLSGAGFDPTVIVADDGSTDGTRAVLRRLVDRDPRVSAIHLRRNRGKSAALRAGLQRVDGDVIVLMDADGQDDPHGVRSLVDAIGDDCDLVTGRRADRHDRFVKRQTSKLYNRATSLLTGVEGRDFNSGLKAMRPEVAMSLDLHGELHRYIPVLAHWQGFRVTEVDVPHRARISGSSKFGGNRFWRGFFDLLTVNFLTRYNSRPLHLFGGLAVGLGFVGVALLTWMLVLKLMGEGVGNRPALLAGVFLVIVAMQMLSIGLVGELVVHSRQSRDDPVSVDVTTFEEPSDVRGTELSFPPASLAGRSDASR